MNMDGHTAVGYCGYAIYFYIKMCTFIKICLIKINYENYTIRANILVGSKCIMYSNKTHILYMFI